MARDQSCPSGLRAYKTKGDAEADADGVPVKRCDRCRFWHVKPKGRRRQERAERSAKKRGSRG